MTVCYNIACGVNKDKCEDAILVGHSVINNGSDILDIVDDCRFFIGDGVGGNAGGDEASRFVMNHIAEMVFKDTESIKKELFLINHKLIEYSKKIKGHEMMATTLTGIACVRGETFLVHCGNTRIYVLQGFYLKQITSDHTTYQWLLDMGNEEAANSCNKNEIQCAFGGGNPAVLEGLRVEKIFERGMPKFILMTTDGVHDYLSVDEMEDIVTKDDNVKSIADDLIRQSRCNGSKDDCSVMIIQGLR